MTGYTRQSAADIVPGEDILSGPLNDEFNTLEDAFNGSTGHIHDGTTGNGPKINLTTSVIGALPTANIADGSITTVKIADSNVTTSKIADGNVTTVKIADSNVTTAKIADGNVTTVKIADGNVTAVKIADGNVTAVKLASGAAISNISNNSIIKAKLEQLSNYTVLGNVSGSLGNVSEVSILNDSTMGANSSTAIPTQQSVKGYVDAKAFNVALPSQTGNSGKFVTTDGTNASWASISQVPSQTGSSGLFLKTDGTNASWASPYPTQTGNANKYLKTDGTNPSWSTISEVPSQTGNSGKFLKTDGTNASWAFTTLQWINAPTSVSAVSGNIYSCTAGITVTFPSSPTTGDRIGISTESTAESSSVTINLNGQSFDSSTSNIVIARGVTLIFEYFNSAWRLAA